MWAITWQGYWESCRSICYGRPFEMLDIGLLKPSDLWIGSGYISLLQLRTMESGIHWFAARTFSSTSRSNMLMSDYDGSSVSFFTRLLTVNIHCRHFAQNRWFSIFQARCLLFSLTSLVAPCDLQTPSVLLRMASLELRLSATFVLPVVTRPLLHLQIEMTLNQFIFLLPLLNKIFKFHNSLLFNRRVYHLIQRPLDMLCPFRCDCR